MPSIASGQVAYYNSSPGFATLKPPQQQQRAVQFGFCPLCLVAAGAAVATGGFGGWLASQFGNKPPEAPATVQTPAESPSFNTEA